MRDYSRTHLSDAELSQRLHASSARKCLLNAELLADLAEYDKRQLFKPAGHSSMFSYCVRRLKMSRQGAYKRIRVARLVAEFPGILQVVEQGRVHISGLVMLAGNLTSENADGLLRAATHKTEREIDQLLAERFPRPDVPALVQALPAAAPAPLELSLRRVETPSIESVDHPPTGGDPDKVPESELTLRRVEVPSPAGRIKPLAPQRFSVQFTAGQSLHDKMRYAQELLGHQVAPGDLEQFFERAVDALIVVLEHKKFGATNRPHSKQRLHRDPRHIPSAVKREVWKRDCGQCTFRSESGHRCEEKHGLEYDHVDPVARGGTATVENTRLLCHAHNQYEAEKTFGADFMKSKREGDASRATA